MTEQSSNNSILKKATELELLGARRKGGKGEGEKEGKRAGVEKSAGALSAGQNKRKGSGKWGEANRFIASIVVQRACAHGPPGRRVIPTFLINPAYFAP